MGLFLGEGDQTGFPPDNGKTPNCVRGGALQGSAFLWKHRERWHSEAGRGRRDTRGPDHPQPRVIPVCSARWRILPSRRGGMGTEPSKPHHDVCETPCSSRTQPLQQQEPAEPHKRRNLGKLDGFSKAFIRAGSWAGCHHKPGSGCPGPGCPRMGSTSCTQPLVLQSLSLSFSSTSDGNSWNHHGSSWQNLITRE